MSLLKQQLNKVINLLAARIAERNERPSRYDCSEIFCPSPIREHTPGERDGEYVCQPREDKRLLTQQAA